MAGLSTSQKSMQCTHMMPEGQRKSKSTDIFMHMNEPYNLKLAPTSELTILILWFIMKKVGELFLIHSKLLNNLNFNLIGIIKEVEFVMISTGGMINIYCN
jgi:hypothetical protein